ncbi:unnamed protein product [Peniophora sp. CBMAI 1063]|nr:unnamed protein product [Peniophora sp. CBMAI 1063]
MDESLSLDALSESWGQRLFALGDDVQAVESGLLAARGVARLYAEQLNDFNYAVSLPAEILEAIFLSVKGPKDDEEASIKLPYTPQRRRSWSYSPLRAPVVPTRASSWSPGAEWVLLTHVCRRWRQVAVGYRDLWADVDAHTYGGLFCQEMISRIGCREFSLSANIQTHKELLLDVPLRKCFLTQLSSLTLDIEQRTVTHLGAFLDNLFLYMVNQPSHAALRFLRLNGRSSGNLSWSTLAPILPTLTSLHLVHINMRGRIPTSLSMLVELTLSHIDLQPHAGSDGPNAPRIVKLVSAMPVLKSIAFIDCSFDSFTWHTKMIPLPVTVQLAHFEVSDSWRISQCRNLSRTLAQSGGDRVFRLRTSSEHSALPLFSAVRDILEGDWDLYVHEVAVKLVSRRELNVSVEFRRAHSAREPRPYRVCFHEVSPDSWRDFCSSVVDIDMGDANLHFICDHNPRHLDESNLLTGFRRLNVTSIYLTGYYGGQLAVSLFSALRESDRQEEDAVGNDGDESALAFPGLRDICVEQYAPTDYGYGYGSDRMTEDLDESALVLLWYARERLSRRLRPVRTVALPAGLMHRRWVAELDDLLEDGVVSYDVHMKESEVETTDCRAVVLYRPVLRALAFWETWLLAIAPG